MGSNPRSNLSQNQIIQKVYDSDNDRLRVDAQYTASIDGDLEIAINSANDSIAIGDEAGNKVTTTELEEKVLLDVNIASSVIAGDSYKLVPLEFDEIEISVKNANGDPQTILYKTANSIIAVVNITYDADGDFESATRS